MRLAVLDLGLRSFHLAVFETSDRAGNPAGGSFAERAAGIRRAASLLCRRSWSETVRMASGTAQQKLGDASLARGLASVKRLLRDKEAFDPTCPVVAFATAALRESEGGPAFCAQVERRHGVAVELLSGEGEARLSYLGARSHVAPPGRLAVADLGGFSLELASGSGSECDLVFSLPVGVLILRDVYLHPERALDRAARERVAATVRFGAADAARAIWDRRPEMLALTSGTARALGALADELGLRRPGADELGVSALARLADVLAQFRPVELPALGIEESRSDAIAVGAVVFHTVMELLGFDSAVISPRGRREGAALRNLARSGQVSAADRFHTAVT